jgi:trehalose 6-phosphate phosphatase
MATAVDLPIPLALGELLAAGPVALFLDFDGTLIEIAAVPDAIDVPAGFGATLARLSGRVGGRLALVSGRSIADLERYLGPLALACAGSHGAAMRDPDGTWLGDQPSALDAAIIGEVSAFAEASGATYEPKDHGAALHSRAAPHLEERCALFMDALAARHGLTVKRGKFVAELVRAGVDKGAAVRAFMAEAPFAGARPIFIGDDMTDEDGFAAVREYDGLAITVGPRDSRLAAFGLADPSAVRDWLGL